MIDHLDVHDVVDHLSNHDHHQHHDRPQNYDHHDVHNVVCHCHHHDHHLNYYHHHHHHESIMITTTIMTTITKVRLTLMCTMLLATEIQESRAMLQGSTAQVTLDKRKLHFPHFC